MASLSRSHRDFLPDGPEAVLRLKLDRGLAVLSRIWTQHWGRNEKSHREQAGRPVEEIETPVVSWHGTHDLFVPLAHGEWLAKRIPNVQAHLSDEDGHLTLLQRVPEMHAWLVEHL